METQNQNADASTMRTEQSAEIAELFGALALAQGEFGEIKKNRKVSVKTKSGGSYTFRYATLDSIIAATRQALSKHGLSTSSWVKGEWLTVMLTHKSGQWKASHVKVGVPNGDWQAYGSALTYSRRHVTSAMLDVAADEDDDGNAACGNQITEREGDQMEAIWNGLEDKGITEGQKQREWIELVLGRQIQHPSQITPEDIVVLKETLDGKRPVPTVEGDKKPAQNKQEPSAEEVSKRKLAAMAKLATLLVSKGISGKDQLPWVSLQVEHNVAKMDDLTGEEYKAVFAAAEKLPAKSTEGKAA